jgi:Peptidase M16 inactive domain
VRVLLLTLLATLTLGAQPKVQPFVLPNGLRVFHLEDHEHPLVRARLQLDLAPADTPAGREGLSALALRMFQESGSGVAKADDFDLLLDGSGIQLTREATPSGLAWQVVARSRDQDRALGLLAENLLQTVFDPATLRRQAAACWRDQEGLGASPQVRLRRALAVTPGARPTQASLSAITLQDLIAFRSRVFRPDRAVLVLHGDLGLEQAKRLVLLNLGSWASPVRPVGDGDPRPPTAPEDPVRIPSPGLGLTLQAMAPPPPDLTPEVLALLDLLVPGDPLLPPVRVTLEGYGLVATLEPGPDTPAPQAMAALQARLAALSQRGYTQLELERARGAWLARRSLDSLHPEALLASALAEARGRGATPGSMKALSLEALNAGLRSWLAPDRFRTGAAGPPEVLAQLAPLQTPVK